MDASYIQNSIHFQNFKGRWILVFTLKTQQEMEVQYFEICQLIVQSLQGLCDAPSVLLYLWTDPLPAPGTGANQYISLPRFTSIPSPSFWHCVLHHQAFKFTIFITFIRLTVEYFGRKVFGTPILGAPLPCSSGACVSRHTTLSSHLYSVKKK